MSEAVGTVKIRIGMESTDTKHTRGRGRGRGRGRKPTVSQQTPAATGNDAADLETFEEDSEHVEPTPTTRRTGRKSGALSSPPQQNDTASLAGTTSFQQQTFKEKEEEQAEEGAHAKGAREKSRPREQNGPSMSQRVAAAATAAAEDTAAQVKVRVAGTTGSLLSQMRSLSPNTLIRVGVALLALLLCFSAARMMSRAGGSEQNLDSLKAELATTSQTYLALSQQINDSLGLQMQAAARLQQDWQETLVTLQQLAQEWKEVAEASGAVRENWEREVVQKAEDHAEHVVEKELQKLDADKTEMADFALATAGGRVVAHSALFPSQNLPMWFILCQWLASTFPRVFPQPLHPKASKMVLTQRGMPGECLCLNGSRGVVEIALRSPVLPTAITLEHVPPSISFEPGSAPRTFTVEGIPTPKLRLRDSGPFGGQVERRVPEGPFHLGKFSYDPKPGPLQTYLVESKHVMERIILQVLDNHGARYTCLYRIRVHGDTVEGE